VNQTTPCFLVTGATGFLGRHVVEAIRRHDPDSRIVALVRDASAASQPPLEYLEGVELVEGSLMDSERWQSDPRLQQLSGIFHLAGEVKHTRADLRDMMDVNVHGTTAMVRLAAVKRSRIIFVSSSGTVGCSDDSTYSPDESAPWCEEIVREWPYYISKIRAEEASRALADENGTELVIMRPPVMLGPGDHRFRSTSSVIRAMDSSVPLVMKGGMNFCDIRDVANAMVRAATLPSPQPVYNLPGHESTLEEFFRSVGRAAGVERRWIQAPTRLLLFAARLNSRLTNPFSLLPDPVVIEMASRYWGISSLYAERELGYRSRNADVTLRDTVEWIRANPPVGH
jgi:nucleoside-diphosphate-sugar epimerase